MAIRPRAPDPSRPPLASRLPSDRFRPGFSVAGLLSALPDFGLGGTFLVTWVAPFTFGRSMVAHLLLVMLLEFIIVHSSGFMGVAVVSAGSRRGRMLTIIGLGLFYSLFLIAFSVTFKTAWPFFAFWGLTANRLLGVLIGQAPSGEEKALVMIGWAASVAFYLLFVFATTLLPVPALGISDEVVRAQRLSGGGLWVEEPHRVVAFGFLYFTALAVSETFCHGWIPRRQDGPATA